MVIRLFRGLKPCFGRLIALDLAAENIRFDREAISMVARGIDKWDREEEENRSAPTFSISLEES
jgi:hypothetical protein